MAQLLSKQVLHALRNHIPVDVVIKDFLNMPCKMSEGYFRFLCPICSEFVTAVNPKTNLARCFLCEKNFNPIDMVMCMQKCNFLQAVQFLQNRTARPTDD